MQPEVLVNLFEKSPILVGKNVDFADFTIEAPAFHIEKYFENMGWVSVATFEEHAYPRLVKEFYQNIVISLRSDKLSCLIKNVRIIVNKVLIREILELKPCDTQIFLHKTYLTLEGYNPSEACRRVARKNFENITKLVQMSKSSNTSM